MELINNTTKTLSHHKQTWKIQRLYSCG